MNDFHRKCPKNKDGGYWNSKPMHSIYIRDTQKKFVRVPDVYHCPYCNQIVYKRVEWKGKKHKREPVEVLEVLHIQDPIRCNTKGRDPDAEDDDDSEDDD